MATRPGELEADVFSESSEGRPIKITSVTNTAADPIHIMTSTVTDAMDALWLIAHNNHTAIVTVHIVMNPVDDTNASNVTDATIDVLVPRGASISILAGEKFRFGTAAYTVGAYVGSGDASRIWIRGYYVRRVQGVIVP